MSRNTTREEEIVEEEKTLYFREHEVSPLKSPDDGEWRDNAECKKAGNTFFFANGINKKALKIALSFCDVCAVKQECLRFAVDNDIIYGVWGGLTPEQRKTLSVSVMLQARE